MQGRLTHSINCSVEVGYIRSNRFEKARVPMGCPDHRPDSELRAERHAVGAWRFDEGRPGARAQGYAEGQVAHTLVGDVVAPQFGDPAAVPTAEPRSQVQTVVVSLNVEIEVGLGAGSPLVDPAKVAGEEVQETPDVSLVA